MGQKQPQGNMKNRMTEKACESLKKPLKFSDDLREFYPDVNSIDVSNRNEKFPMSHRTSRECTLMLDDPYAVRSEE